MLDAARLMSGENRRINSFHCLFCHGFEELGVVNAAALLTSDDDASIDRTVFHAHLARQLTHGITFLANGLSNVEEQPKIVVAKTHGFKIEKREIMSMNKAAPGSFMMIEFTESSVAPFGFMFYKPKTIVSGPTLLGSY